MPWFLVIIVLGITLVSLGVGYAAGYDLAREEREAYERQIQRLRIEANKRHVRTIPR